MASAPAPPIIGVHLDMKGIVFRPGYLPQLLRDLASQGVNTVLMEYEDIFPFEGIDVAFDPPTVWSRRTIDVLRREARRNGIEIIPLQQCLGHLEWVFRWNRYARFAEDPQYPSTLCLTDPEGKALVREMLRQVLEAHPESRYVHLGMDEAHALQGAAARAGRPVLELFVEYLLELVDFVEQYGKTPVIWSDMLEDHFLPGIFDAIKDRVVLCPWDYGTTTSRSPRGRLLGPRISKAWLAEPDNPLAPAVPAGAAFFEDLQDDLQRRIEPYRHDREYDSLFQVDLWSALGFRVLGASCVRDVSHDCLLPNYLVHAANLRVWAEAIQRNRQLGVIATSWSRGTTFCPPTYPQDVFWASVAALGRAMGATPQPFFPGIPDETVHRLCGQLGRCLRDWAIEDAVCDEMEALSPGLTDHQYEWRSLILLGRIFSLNRQAHFAGLEVDYFLAAGRPVPAEWQRRIDDQQRLLAALGAMRRKARAHFGVRCHGRHFTEWLDHVLTIPQRQLRECTQRSRALLRRAEMRYGA